MRIAVLGGGNGSFAAAGDLALEQQDGLYTLGIRDAEPGWRVIAAHNRFLAAHDAAETAALLASADVGLVTTTVTEKGYCLAPDGTLDLAHPDIVHDAGGAALTDTTVRTGVPAAR